VERRRRRRHREKERLGPEHAILGFVVNMLGGDRTHAKHSIRLVGLLSSQAPAFLVGGQGLRRVWWRRGRGGCGRSPGRGGEGWRV